MFNERSDTVLFAILLACLMIVVVANLIGCEVVQPLLDEAITDSSTEEAASSSQEGKVIVDPVEYYRIIPGVGLEYKTADMDRPGYIRVKESVAAVLADHEVDPEFITSSPSGLQVDVVDERWGRINFYQYDDDTIQIIAVYDPRWMLDTGVNVGDTRADTILAYGEPHPSSVFWQADYKQKGFAFWFNPFLDAPVYDEPVRQIKVYTPR